MHGYWNWQNIETKWQYSSIMIGIQYIYYVTYFFSYCFTLPVTPVDGSAGIKLDYLFEILTFNPPRVFLWFSEGCCSVARWHLLVLKVIIYAPREEWSFIKVFSAGGRETYTIIFLSQIFLDLATSMLFSRTKKHMEEAKHFYNTRKVAFFAGKRRRWNKRWEKLSCEGKKMKLWVQDLFLRENIAKWLAD